MPAPVALPEPKRLDHLPVIAHALKKLRVRQVVDELVAKDPRSRVSTGECIEALVTAILLGKHTLYQVGQLLEPYDLQVAFGFNQVAQPSNFNDTRLAKALDDLFDVGGVPKVNLALTLSAVREYELSIQQVHVDLTSVSVHGDYAFSEPPADPEDPQAIPHVTHGYSKAHRPDLKQVVFGLSVVSDGAVPVCGRVSSGNRGDGPETRFMLRQLRESLPDPTSVLYVGDSKMFSGETLALMSAHDLDFVTLLPRSVGLWQRVYALFAAEGERAPTLKVKCEDDDLETARYWRGRSYEMPYEFEHDGSDYSIPLRLLVVESDALKERKRPGFERRRVKERAALEKLAVNSAKQTYACQLDAERAMARALTKKVTVHRLEARVVAEQQRRKRARPGRPRKDERHEHDEVWRVVIEVHDDPAAAERRFREETCFVLVTSKLAGSDREDADRRTLVAYDEQDHVERCFRWAKHPLAVAPIYLKTPKRIAALGLVYVIALMVYALIQRDVRQRLAAADTSMPGNRGWTRTPTTEVIFRAFRGVSTLDTKVLGEPIYVIQIDTEQVRLFNLFGLDLLHRAGIACLEPRVPRPGSRTAKPVPRGRRKRGGKKSK